MNTAVGYALIRRGTWRGDRESARPARADDEIVQDALATLWLARFPRKG